MCHHDLTTPGTMYDRESNRLFYILVCDACHNEIQRLPGPEYKPSFVPTPLPKSS